MGCFIEFNDIRFDFIKNRLKQKTWIEILLQFTNLDINQLAALLELSDEMLINVRLGYEYLALEDAEKLGRLFLIAFGY